MLQYIELFLSKAGSFASVCDSFVSFVCFSAMISNCSNFVIGNDIGIAYKCYDFGFQRSKVKLFICIAKKH